MCRSIKKLRVPEQSVTPEEIRAAALQYVRKISGFHKPSKKNQEMFDRAVSEVAAASDRLLSALTAEDYARTRVVSSTASGAEA